MISKKTILSFLFLAIMSLGSMSVVLSRHFCHDTVKSVSINSKAKGCHVSEKESDDDCCTTETEVERLEELSKVTLDQSIDIRLDFFIADYLSLPITGITSVEELYLAFEEFVPPPDDGSAHLVNCVFLI